MSPTESFYSIVPQLVQQRNASLSREYAVYIAKEQAITDYANITLRHDVVSQILETSISQLTITLSPAGYPNSNQSFEIVKTYFETCIDLDCLDQAGNVVVKVVDTTGQSVAEAQGRAKLLILPFLTWVAQFLARQSNNLIEVPKLDMLQKAAITPILDEMTARRGVITREEVGQLLQTVSLPGGMDMFVAQ